MKVKFANRIYEVLFTKELAGLTMYAVEDEPNHIDWLINVEVIDAEKKELRKIEDEEYNEEDYGIDSLFHAQRILEKTLGSVDGYQSDDGILEHKCAISAVKKLYEQKPAWSEEDCNRISSIKYLLHELDNYNFDNWLDSLKNRVQPKQDWSEEDKKMFVNIKACLRNANKDYSREVDWLKSIKPQPKNEWSEEDERMRQETIDWFENKCFPYALESENPARESINWLKSLRPQIDVTDEELAQAKKDAYNDALDKIEYHSGEPTFDDGWSAAIWYLKKMYSLRTPRSRVMMYK